MSEAARLALACTVLVLCAACAGELSNPERFLDSGDGGGGVGCMDVETDILASALCSNSGCHDTDQPAAGLDLQSAGLGARLIDIPSQDCSDRLLVDSSNIEASYFLESLLPSPSCGSQMPIGALPLSDDEIDCVRQWIEGL